MNDRSRGQVLPLFALMLIALFAIAALAIDVSNALQARRTYRTIADAAALAGGQDLQQVGSRDVNSSDYNRARTHAIESVQGAVGATATCTAPSTARSDCTFATLPYTFSIITPIPPGACATCDPTRSIQVNFADPTFGLTFARILGQSTWNVESISVAGLQFNKSYTIVALRPPKGEAIPDVRSMRVDGGTHVFVSRGDVGTNANMTYGGTNSWIQLDSGYQMFYFDPSNPPLWGSSPPSTQITDLILDPLYPIPVKGGSPPVGTEDVSGCPAIAAGILANAQYAPAVPVDALGAPDMTKIHCYTKGVYPNAAWDLNVANGTLAILEPGLYFMDGVLDVQGSLIGGYTPNSEGVALVFRESVGTQFKNRTSGGGGSVQQIVALNAGTRYGNANGDEATAARDYSGGFVQTNTTPPVLMTVIVQRDTRCPVTYPFPADCNNSAENDNKSIDLSGGSGLYLAGVQYAPTDNITLAGNTTTGGYVGQIWAWTIKYTGGSVINQEGAQAEEPGVLRLDAACTAPGTPCIP